MVLKQPLKITYFIIDGIASVLLIDSEDRFWCHQSCIYNSIRINYPSKPISYLLSHRGTFHVSGGPVIYILQSTRIQ